MKMRVILLPKDGSAKWAKLAKDGEMSHMYWANKADGSRATFTGVKVGDIIDGFTYTNPSYTGKDGKARPESHVIIVP